MMPETVNVRGRLLFMFLGLVVGLWLITPGRNVTGNPWFEKLMQECRSSNGATFRLCAGDGGATVEPSWTVTYRTDWFGRERQVFCSGGSPEVTSIRCEADGVALVGPDAQIQLPYGDMAKLADDPLTYPVGKQDRAELQFMRILSMLLGSAFLAALGLGSFVWHRQGWRGLRS